MTRRSVGALGSDQFGKATDVEPYPVQLGNGYHDGSR